MDDFGQRLRAIRQEKELSQKDLAEQMEMTQAAISQFENGRRSPTPANIKKLAEVLEVDPTELSEKTREQIETEMLMRNAKGLSPESLREINKYAQYIRDQEKGDQEKDEK